MIYLASPIDFAGEWKGLLRDWRTGAEAQLRAAGLGVYDPSKPFGGPRADDAPAIGAVNRAALEACSGVLALLPGAKSVGVPAEIQLALELGRRVAVAVGDQGAGFYLEGLKAQRPQEVFLGREWHLKEMAAWLLEGEREWLNREPKREVKWTGSGEFRPRVGWPGDAGWDLWVSEDVVIEGGEFVDVPCGVSVQLPEGVWGMITGRSSTLRKRGLLVTQGIIDQGYRGPLFAGVQSLNKGAELVKRGERLAQLIPMPVLTTDMGWRAVEKLDESERGGRGFGSTGT